MKAFQKKIPQTESYVNVAAQVDHDECSEWNNDALWTIMMDVIVIIFVVVVNIFTENRNFNKNFVVVLFFLIDSYQFMQINNC